MQSALGFRGVMQMGLVYVLHSSMSQVYIYFHRTSPITCNSHSELYQVKRKDLAIDIVVCIMTLSVVKRRLSIGNTTFILSN